MNGAVTIRFRQDTAVRWAQSDFVLKKGEPGFEDDTGRFKIGDGTARWLDLEYFAPGDVSILSQEIQDYIRAITPSTINDDGPSLLLLYQNAKV